jgi:hypothetical protein
MSLASQYMKRITVAVASPSDVPDEREAVTKVCNKWNVDNHELPPLVPQMWEFATPELGDHPQTIINRQIIAISDLLVAVLHSKLGTPTPNASSGTVEEIEEFITNKGAGRVLLYFCKRSLPVDIDPTELMRLNAFKKSMQSKGLFKEFATTTEFESDLYRHIDVKVHELLEHKLPPPAKSAFQKPQPDSKILPADKRLHKLIEFGTDLESIASGFYCRMDEFNAIDGCTNDKFYAFGAHVYTSVATCLDRYLTHSAVGLDYQDQRILEKISASLKHMAANFENYSSDFRDYWKDGTKAAMDLKNQAAHMKKRGLPM